MKNDELTRLYSDHAESLYAFLSYRTGDRVLAEDLLGDTFERVMRARKGYDRRRAGERTWLYTIALNCVRDNARRTAAEARALARVLTATPPADDCNAGTVEDRDALHKALGTLTEDEREAVALRFGADLSLGEIASLLDLPRTRVETRIYRGLKKLRGRVAPDLRATA